MDGVEKENVLAEILEREERPFFKEMTDEKIADNLGTSFVFYLAGLYRSSSVMVFILAFLVFLGCMGFLAKYLARRLEISLEPERGTVSKESTLTVVLTAVNPSLVPVMKFETRMKIWNQGTSKGAVKKYRAMFRQGYCKDSGGSFSKALWCPGDQRSEVKNLGPAVSFCGQKKEKASCNAVVYPKGYEMQFSIESLPLAWKWRWGTAGREFSLLKYTRYRLIVRGRDEGYTLEADCQKRGAPQQTVLYRSAGTGVRILGYPGRKAFKSGTDGCLLGALLCGKCRAFEGKSQSSGGML